MRQATYPADCNGRGRGLYAPPVIPDHLILREDGTYTSTLLDTRRHFTQADLDTVLRFLWFTPGMTTVNDMVRLVRAAGAQPPLER